MQALEKQTALFRLPVVEFINKAVESQLKGGILNFFEPPASVPAVSFKPVSD